MGEINPKNFVVVQGWMITDLDLKNTDLMVYACIYGFSQSDGHSFKGSIQYLADWTHSTKQTVISSLKRLVGNGLIEKSETFCNGVKFCEYKSLTGSQKVLMGGSQKFLPNNIEDLNDIIPPLPPKGNFEEGKGQFSQFWSCYPKKVGKGAAEKSWNRLKVTDILLEKMLKAIEWQKNTDQWKKDKGQFIPMPATWLNQRRWEDERSDEGGVGERWGGTQNCR